jgi:hypothetical protein
MKVLFRHKISNVVSLPFFNLGTSYLTYYFMMFLCLPFIIEFSDYVFDTNFYEILSLTFIRNEIYSYDTVVYSIYGLISFFIGYSLVRKRYIVFGNLLYANWNIKRLYLISIWLFIFGYVIKLKTYLTDSVSIVMYSDSLSGIPLLTFFITPNPFHMFALLLGIIGYFETLKNYSYNLHKKIKLSTILMLLIYLISIVDLGSKLKMLAPFIFFIIIKNIYFPMKLKNILFYLLLTIFTIFFIDRALNTVVNQNNASTFLDKIEVLTKRISQINTLDSIIEKDKPMLLGYTFQTFFEEFKPYSMEKIYFESNKFGREYNLIDPNDNKTGIAITNPGELYMNFGVGGIVIGLFFLGAIYKLYYNSFKRTNMYFLLTYPFLWVIIIYGVESQVSVILASIIKYNIILFVIHLLLIDYKINRRL